MIKDPNSSPTEEYEEVDDTLEDILYARHAEISTFQDLEKQRGTSIPALFNQLYKFVQNPSSVSVETFKRMVDTDDTIGSGVDFLTLCLSARMGRYTHKNKEITEFVNKALDEIEGGYASLLKRLMSACWAGFAVGEIVWANKEHGFVPHKVVVLPPTTILFETERTGELTPDGIMQYQRNYNPYLASGGMGYLSGGAGVGSGFIGTSNGRPDPFAKFGDYPFPLRTANSFNYLSIRIPTQKCVHFPFDAQGSFGNPYGKSLLRRIYKFYVMKDAILQMKMIALDRKGTSLTIVYADPNAMIMTEGSTTAEARGNKYAGVSADEAARKAFQNIHNDSTIILPGKKGQIYETEFMPQASNVTDFIAAEDFCNKSILRGLLIPSLIFGNGDGTGSYALGEAHQNTFDKICDGENAPLEYALLQQLVKPIIAYNFPREMWEKEGLGSFSKRTLSKEEVEKEMAMFEQGINSGIIDQNDLNDLNKMRDTIGFEPRDTIIEKPMMPGMGLPGDEDGGAPGAGDTTGGVGQVGGDEKPAAGQEEKTEAQEKKSKMSNLFAQLKALVFGSKTH